MKTDTWIKALAFAALPGARQVTFSRESANEDGTPTTRYTLKSYGPDGAVIGDDRDYDLLKAAMGPLEKLSEAKDSDFTVTLDLQSQTLR